MVLRKQAVTKCRKNQVFIVPQIKQKYSIPSHRVLLDDNLPLKEHIKYLENKIATNIGLMYRGKSFLDKDSLLALYYSYIHSYLNYANLTWGSTYLTNLKKLRSQQKHAIRIVHNKTKFEHTK